MNAKRIISASIGIFLGALMLVSQVAYAAVAGYTQFVIGNVQIVNALGETSTLKKGDAISEGDMVSSAHAASAQIKMQDGGMIAVRPDTKLKFDSFVFSGKQDGNERSYFSLLKGGFRAITGVIGRANKSSYRITTPTATIGIRGTDHETIEVTPDSPLAKAAPAGVYNKVNVGETFMTTDMGTIFVLANQMAYAGAKDQMPQLLPMNPNIFTVAANPTSQVVNKKKDENAVRDQAVVDTGEHTQVAEVQVIPVAVDNFKLPVCSTDPVTGKCVDLVVPPAPLAPTLPKGAGNGVYPAQGSILGVMTQNTNPATSYQETWTASSRLLPVNFDANGILTIANWCQGCGVNSTDVARIAVNGAAATSFDFGADSGVVAWGRWSNGNTTFGGWGPVTLGQDQGFHIVVGLQTAVLPTTAVTARYNMIGATAPTNNLVAGLTTGPVTSSGFLDVNFGTSALNTQMNIDSGNAAFQIVGTGMANKGSPDFSMTGTMTRNGGTAPFCATACPTNMVGSFFGVDATNAGIAYRADALYSGGGVIDGAAVFRK